MSKLKDKYYQENFKKYNSRALGFRFVEIVSHERIHRDSLQVPLVHRTERNIKT
jgi:hypothetical protein